MAKPKIPYGYTRDPKTGRLRKKRAAGRKATGKRTTRRKKTKSTQKGGNFAALRVAQAAARYGPKIAKVVGPIVVPILLDELKKKLTKKGSGLRLMGQRNK